MRIALQDETLRTHITARQVPTKNHETEDLGRNDLNIISGAINWLGAERRLPEEAGYPPVWNVDANGEGRIKRQKRRSLC